MQIKDHWLQGDNIQPAEYPQPRRRSQAALSGFTTSPPAARWKARLRICVRPTPRPQRIWCSAVTAVIVQLAPFNRVTWHARVSFWQRPLGGLNQYIIGISRRSNRSAIITTPGSVAIIRPIRW